MADAVTTYVHIPFPKVMYHATEGPRTVENQAELDALGAGWHDTPDRSGWHDGDKAPPDDDELQYTPPPGGIHATGTLPHEPPPYILPEGPDAEPPPPRSPKK